MPAPLLAPARQRRWPPIVVALAMQVVAAALTMAVAYLLAPAGVVLRPIIAAVLTGVFAAALGRLAGLDVWWVWIQLLFVPATMLATSIPIPRWVWSVLVVALAAVYWSTFRTQVPLYLSSSKVRRALVSQLPAGAFTFVDVGSGLGGVLIDLAAARPDGIYHGIESAPVPWLLSWLRIRVGRHANCHAHWGSLWNCDLSMYDVVFAYLSPVPMAALWEKVQREMRPGSQFISNTFAVAGEQPAMVVAVDDLHHSTLYSWTHR